MDKDRIMAEIDYERVNALNDFVFNSVHKRRCK